MRADFMAYLKRCIDATAQAEKAIENADELLKPALKDVKLKWLPR